MEESAIKTTEESLTDQIAELEEKNRRLKETLSGFSWETSFFQEESKQEESKNENLQESGFIPRAEIVEKLQKKIDSLTKENQDLEEQIRQLQDSQKSQSETQIDADVEDDPVEKKSDLPTFLTLVDYDQSIEDLVKSGNYDSVHSGITDHHFPTQNKGKVQLEMVLVHFNRRISTDEAIKELEKMGLQPAGPKELLSFGAQYPDKQKEFPIIALGQSWRDSDGDQSAPCLYWYGGQELFLGWVGLGWYSRCRFLAFRHRTGA